MRLIDANELYAAFRRDIMGGLNYDRILREAKPVDAVPVSWIMSQVKERAERGTAFDISVASILRTMVKEWKDEQTD